MASPVAAVAFAAASVALLAVAAKAHGRQVRLERELAGYHHVDFGAGNPPWVEQLWARDRRAFLRAFGLLAAAGLALWLLGIVAARGPSAWPGALLVLLWAFTGSFVVAGLGSLRRWMAVLAARTEYGTTREDEVRQERPAWLRAAERGNAVWWGLVAALGAALAGLAGLGAAPL